MKRLTHCAMAAALTLGLNAAPALANDVGVDTAPSAVAMTADLIVVRPLSLVATIVGTGIYVVQLPLSVIQNEYRTPARKLIVEPARYTFSRPLGEME